MAVNIKDLYGNSGKRLIHGHFKLRSMKLHLGGVYMRKLAPARVSYRHDS